MQVIELYHKGTKIKWYENALPFDVYPWSDRSIVNKVCEILEKLVFPVTQPIRAVYRNREAIKVILLNLYIAYKLGMPVRYSRDSNLYSVDSRYRKLFHSYKRVVPSIDVLIENGYIVPHNGHNDNDDPTYNLQSRMWASPKLIELFQVYEWDTPGLITKTQPAEIIQLKMNFTKRVGKRGKKRIYKKPIPYVDDHTTIARRNQLREYNNFISEQDVTIELTGEQEVNPWFLRDLILNFRKGVFSLNNINIDHTVQSNVSNSVVYNNVYQYNSINKSVATLNYTTITHNLRNNEPEYTLEYSDEYSELVYIDYINTLLKPILSIEDNEVRNRKLKETNKLSYYGINRLRFTILYKYSHRVFSQESFDNNGRFYGSGHLGLPRPIRKGCLFINGSPTVEPDFSALHIRMLYHREGLPYDGDPYLKLCDGNKELRDQYKLIQLIAINTNSEKQTCKAVRQEIRDRMKEQYFIDPDYSKNWDLSDKFILEQLERFKEVHKSIAGYLNQGIGLELQNTDARITEGILNRFTDDGIPCLPVHDSYITPVEHEDLLVQVMMEEYEKEMGFSPIIG